MAEQTRPPKTESAWQQGANAYRAGRPEANPYRYDPGKWDSETLDHVGWSNGYCWAVKRHREEGNQ